MTRVAISSFKAHLSEHLRRVEAGGEIEVLDRSRPIARVVPIEPAEVGAEILPASRSFASVRGVRPRAVRATMSSLEALRRDRGTR
jgi:prevent-host-death family protein